MSAPGTVITVGLVLVYVWIFGVVWLLRGIEWLVAWWERGQRRDTRKPDVTRLDELMEEKRRRERVARKYRAR